MPRFIDNIDIDWNGSGGRMNRICPLPNKVSCFFSIDFVYWI